MEMILSVLVEENRLENARCVLEYIHKKFKF